jgi:hypothetical protein
MKRNDARNAELDSWPMFLWLVLGPLPLILALAYHPPRPAKAPPQMMVDPPAALMVASKKPSEPPAFAGKPEKPVKGNQPPTKSR